MDKCIKIQIEDFKKDPSTIKFEYLHQEEKKTGFAILYNGSYHVYKNQCMHLSVELDWSDNQFFDEDDDFIVCATHGAIYKPDTGLCEGGPCKGKALIPMKFKIIEKHLLVDVNKETNGGK